MDIKELFVLLLTDRARERDIARLAHTCHALAKSLITSFHTRHLRHFSLAEYSTESFAWRCITDLFLPRNGESCHELRTYLRQRFPDPSLCTAEEAAIALRTVVSKKVSQTIPEIYGELDPDFRRLLRNILRHVKGSGGYTLVHSVHGLLVLRVNAHIPLREKAEMPGDELLRLLAERGRAGDAASHLVDAVFDIFSAQTEYRRLYPLLGLAALLRDFHALHKPAVEQVNDPTTVSMEREGVQRRVDRAVEHVGEILLRYTQRGSVPRERAGALRLMMRRVFEDMADGECRTLYDYYHAAFGTDSYIEYRDLWRSKVEYLFRVGRDHLLP